MKRSLLTFLLILSLLCFASCGYKYFYTHEELSDGLISVEIVNVHSRSREQDMSVERIETLKSLNKEEIVQCLDCLTKIEFYRISAMSSPIHVVGKAIKLNYENRSYNSLIIAAYGVLPYYGPGDEIFYTQYVGDFEKIDSLIALFLEIH